MILLILLPACLPPPDWASDEPAERVPIDLTMDDAAYVLGGTAFSVIGDIDVNGDGFPDVLLAAKEQYGDAYTWLGTEDGFERQPETGFYLGYSEVFKEAIPIAVADVNGDGFDDVFATDGDSQQVFGYQSPQSPASQVTWVIPAATDWVASIGNAGDVNRDGYEDLVIGLPSFYTDAPGAVVVHLGSADGPRSDETDTVLHARDNMAGTLDAFGWSVDRAGDVNGDGWPDLLVGGNGGYTQVFYGSETGFSDSATTVLETVGIAWSVAGVGDVNGDGFEDVLVGAPSPDMPQECEEEDDCQGEARLFLGGPDGVSAVPAATRTRTDVEANYGFAVAPAGDINADGRADVIAGTADEPEIFLGTADGIATEPLCRPFKGPGGWSAGDIDRDGLGDVVMSGGYVYLGSTLMANADGDSDSGGEPDSRGEPDTGGSGKGGCGGNGCAAGGAGSGLGVATLGSLVAIAVRRRRQ